MLELGWIRIGPSPDAVLLAGVSIRIFFGSDFLYFSETTLLPPSVDLRRDLLPSPSQTCSVCPACLALLPVFDLAQFGEMLPVFLLLLALHTTTTATAQQTKTISNSTTLPTQEWTVRKSNRQCWAVKEQPTDVLFDPTFAEVTATLEDCKTLCETSVGAVHGRPCVAIEWQDKVRTYVITTVERPKGNYC